MNRRIADVFVLRSRVSEDAQPENSHSNPHVAVISRQKEKEEATPLAFAPLQRTRPPARRIDRSIDRWTDGRIGHENGRNQIKIYGGARGTRAAGGREPPAASSGGPTA